MMNLKSDLPAFSAPTEICVYFPMQELGQFNNLLYISIEAIFAFHFCPPFVPLI